MTDSSLAAKCVQAVEVLLDDVDNPEAGTIIKMVVDQLNWVREGIENCGERSPEQSHQLFPDLPLIDEHEGVDAEMLQSVVKTTNAVVPVFLHCGPEVGFVDNFRLGVIGKSHPRPCVFADMHILAKHVERANMSPRRAVHLWQQKDGESWIQWVELRGGLWPGQYRSMDYELALPE